MAVSSVVRLVIPDIAPSSASSLLSASSSAASVSLSPSSPLASSPGRAQMLSPPSTPKQVTVSETAESTSHPLTSSVSPSPSPSPLPFSSQPAASGCYLTIPQLLEHRDLTTSMQQPFAPHPLLLCTFCMHPVAHHQQTAPASASSSASSPAPPLSPLPSALTEGKLINDPIHGHIHLEADLLRLIDSPHFQRLRDLKQLGSAYLVFPGAAHNRFEHSIGVCHLAATLLQHLSSSQPELRISAKEAFLVKLAGLCHDLGHGPFSHVFDAEFVPRAVPGSHWHHEQASIMMLEDLLSSCQLQLEPADLQLVRELIDPASHPTRSNSKEFLYEIVANARTSLDVDKMDYLARDVHCIGMSTNMRHDRLIKNCRVISNRLCYNSKEVYNIYELFHTRYSLFKQVYSHRVSKALEYMITDVLLLADPVLRISSAIHDPRRYLALTDCVLKQIEFSTEPELAAARSLILRIRTRKLYRLVEECIIPLQLSDMDDVTAEDIIAAIPQSASFSPQPQCTVLPSELAVQNLRIHYGVRDRNPVDAIEFFDKTEPGRSFPIPRSKVSHLVPQHFQERILRVYLKDAEDDSGGLRPKFHTVKAATIAWLKGHDCVSPIVSRTASGVLTRANSSFLLRRANDTAAVSALRPGLDTAGGETGGSSEEPSTVLRTVGRMSGIEEEAAEDASSRLERKRRRRQDSSASSGSESTQREREDSGADSPQPLTQSPSAASARRLAAQQLQHQHASTQLQAPASPSPAASASAAAGITPAAASQRRTSSASMDPPSPVLTHPHASYHVNPTLACHFPSPSPSPSLLPLSASPPPPPRCHSPLLPATTAAAAAARHWPEWKRPRVHDGQSSGSGSGSALGSQSPQSPLSPASSGRPSPLRHQHQHLPHPLPLPQPLPQHPTTQPHAH